MAAGEFCNDKSALRFTMARKASQTNDMNARHVLMPSYNDELYDTIFFTKRNSMVEMKAECNDIGRLTVPMTKW
jgi:hypothetical protein